MPTLNEIDKGENLKDRINPIMDKKLIKILFPREERGKKKKYKSFVSKKDLWLISEEYLVKVMDFRKEGKDAFVVYPNRISECSLSQNGASNIFFSFFVNSIKETLIAESIPEAETLMELIGEYFVPNLS